MENLRPAIQLLQPGDVGWPPGLDDLGTQAPKALWVRGADAQKAPAGWVAIVGTRAADPVALQAARDIAGVACDLGCGVISGGAMGVDGAAHTGALEGGGVTVAVLAGGVDRPGPRRNAGLFQACFDAGGGVWSERPPGSAPFRGAFPRRNRLIAAAARAVIVVQARQRSGSLSTAAHAKRLGRPVAVVPSGWRDGARAGCAQLLRAGARALMGPADLADLLGMRPAEDRGIPPGDAGRVLELLRAGVGGVDGVSQSTGWGVARCLAAMTVLEVGGWWGA